MNQEYRDRVKRHLEAGGDPKYVNVKKKADARHAEYKSQALKNKKAKDPVDVKWDKINKERGLTPSGKRRWHYYNTKI